MDANLDLCAVIVAIGAWIVDTIWDMIFILGVGKCYAEVGFVSSWFPLAVSLSETDR